MRIAKRDELTGNKATYVRIIAILAALVFSGIFLLITGQNPLDVYISMIDGALGSGYRLTETINIAIPLLVASLGMMMAYKMKFWNIGAEGQIFMGAFGATFFALNFNTLPRPLLLILMAIGAMTMGGIWLLIPAYFKGRFGTNETLFTLMMNYVAMKWITYLQYSLWKDPNSMGFPRIANFEENALLPKLFGVHIGWLIALVLVVFVYIYMTRTKTGYELAVIGESENTARYAGISIKSTMFKTMLIGGGIVGLTGMIQVSGISGTLSVELTGGMGYTAVITTWLSGLNAPAAVVVCFLFAMLEQGGSYIQTAFQISASVAQILQSIILFFVLGSEFFIKYKFVRDKKIKEALK
ncbi:nucleoside ABC transporter membrane protein [Alkalibaculum bacchi]|uniref:Nucleoside ABC transporter membrane protein n=1 Tax=Alkalibaculum bacchi TaxID=645887 RepID=A0A366HYJ7_9FIRM|nr:ABC transporter permease [Alkalibaculum bacchi]RBP57647.1 nucleoside ABC transporter membrane protein [Alkalibaculum bacchi]